MAREHEIDDTELLDVADDLGQAASLHKALRTIAANPSVGPELQDMAKGVLSGRIGMKDVIASDRYLDALGDRLGKIREAAEDMTPEERRRSEQRAERMLREAEEAGRGGTAGRSGGPDGGRGDRRTGGTGG
ncbi:hypothetical protein [Streptomyces sp. NPDC001380]|uniref:hypothetical protein n=1 Tax=Streptomyces sp. NPDC001380 TaxID=3364566 RepID=UPI0036B798AB